MYEIYSTEPMVDKQEPPNVLILITFVVAGGDQPSM